jgi:hypothetical protein
MVGSSCDASPLMRGLAVLAWIAAMVPLAVGVGAAPPTARASTPGAGMGRASAPAFAREGARVVVADVGARGGEETVHHIT